MKTRIIQTRFWDDDVILSAPMEARYIYIHLLTCNLINICGIFQYAPSKIQFTTGLTNKQFEIGSKWLDENNKIKFYKGWVYVINARKNNKYEVSDSNKDACTKELNKIPEDVKMFFDNKLDSSVDSTVGSSVDSMPTVIINNNNKIINNNILNNKYSIFIDKFNSLRNTKYQISNELKKNYDYWNKVFTNEQILLAVENIPKHQWLSTIEYTPTIFLRTNKDWIDQCLNLRKEERYVPRMATDEELSNINF